MESKKHTFWVARDNEGTLVMFVSKPKRVKRSINGNNYWTTSDIVGHGMWMYIYNDMFPDLKWEDEPIKVEIISEKYK